MQNETEGRIPLADLLVFHQLARSLTSSFDLDTILHTILEHMERMVEAELWTLLMLDESSQELYYAIAAGDDQEALKGLRVKMGEGLAGWVLQHGETVIVPEAEEDPRLQQPDSAGSRIRARRDCHAVAWTRRAPRASLRSSILAPRCRTTRLPFCTSWPITRPSRSKMRATCPAFSN